jgi:hypothetical protein
MNLRSDFSKLLGKKPKKSKKKSSMKDEYVEIAQKPKKSKATKRKKT